MYATVDSPHPLQSEFSVSHSPVTIAAVRNKLKPHAMRGSFKLTGCFSSISQWMHPDKNNNKNNGRYKTSDDLIQQLREQNFDRRMESSKCIRFAVVGVREAIPKWISDAYTNSWPICPCSCCAAFPFYTLRLSTFSKSHWLFQRQVLFCCTQAQYPSITFSNPSPKLTWDIFDAPLRVQY